MMNWCIKVLAMLNVAWAIVMLVMLNVQPNEAEATSQLNGKWAVCTLDKAYCRTVRVSGCKRRSGDMWCRVRM